MARLLAAPLAAQMIALVALAFGAIALVGALVGALGERDGGVDWQRSELPGVEAQIADALANVLAPSIDGGDPVMVQQVVSQLASAAGLLEVAVLDPDGRIIAHSDPESIGHRLAAGRNGRVSAALRRVREGGQPETLAEHDGPQPRTMRLLPLPAGPPGAGDGRAILIVTLELASRLAAREASGPLSPGIGFLLIPVLACALLFALRLLVLVPISRLTQAVRRSAVERVFQVPSGIPDNEIGDLTRAFEEVIAVLGESSRSLAKASEVLSFTIENFPVAIAVYDEACRLSGCNDLFYQEIGFARSEMPIGTSLAEIIRRAAEQGDYGPGDPEQHVQARMSILRQPRPHCIERVRGDGTVIEIRTFPMPRGGFIAVYNDVTVSRVESDALKKNARTFRLLTEAATAANNARSREQLIADCLEALCAYAGWELGHAYLADSSDPPRYRATDIWCGPGSEQLVAFKELTRKTSFELGQGLVGKVAQSRAALWVVDLAKEPDSLRAAQCSEIAVRGCLMFPVVEGDRVAAVVELFSTRTQPEDPDCLAVCSAVAAQISRFLERDRAQKSLEAAKAAAEEADQQKSNFLATVSHEVRTPMNAIVGTMSLLGDTRLDLEQRQLTSTALAAADDLLTILNDILDYSKLEAGQVWIERIPFATRDLVESALSRHSARATEKGLALTASVGSDVPDLLEGDPTRLRQILGNLIGNAIKFTEQGSITLELSCRDLGAQAVELLFEVSDTGIGIAEASQPRLFERFMQADPSTTRRFGGSGLGLAICKELVELMGGAIGVTSSIDRGSCFWFTAHCKQAPKLEDGAELPDSTSAIRAERPLSVLVAEDNPTNRFLVEAFLRKWGHSVTLVENGAEAVEAARRELFDVILMDIQMPEMDGTTAARQIRTLPGLASKVPIIALTANAMAGQRESYMSTGMDGYQSKPIVPESLRREIARLVRPGPHPAARNSRRTVIKLRKLSEGATMNEQAQPAVEEAPLVDPAQINSLRKFLGDGELATLVGSIADQGSICLRQLQDAVSRCDLAEARKVAHSLKGMAANVGAGRLAEAARWIEVEADSLEGIGEQLAGLEATLEATCRNLAEVA